MIRAHSVMWIARLAGHTTLAPQRLGTLLRAWRLSFMDRDRISWNPLCMSRSLTRGIT